MAQRVKRLPTVRETRVCSLTNLKTYKVFLVAQRVKRLPTVQETRVCSLGQEDPLEKEVATHTSILAWKVPWMEKTGSLQSMGLQRVGHDKATSLIHL